MKVKQEKDSSAKSSFEPYKISIKDSKTLKTFEQILTRVFADLTDTVESKDIEELEVVNELFLLHLAHGIQGVEEYNPTLIPERVKECVQQLGEKFPTREKACQFFLKHFNKITQYHNPETANSSSPNNLEKISPRNTTTLLPFCQTQTIGNKTNTPVKKIKKDRQIEAMCNDIRLLHLTNFLRLHSEYIELGKPIPNDNMISSSFNQLFKLINTDIYASKTSADKFKEKMKLYLKIAQTLLTNKSIIDYEGAAIINCALQLHADLVKENSSLKIAMTQLASLFNVLGNFKILREKMLTNNSIPFYTVISKDLALINENHLWNKIFLFGAQYFSLHSRTSALREQARKEGIFHPVYQTNLCTLLEGCSLFWSASPRKENEIDSLPTLTCKTYILTKDHLFYWDKANNVYKEQQIKDNDIATLSMKLDVQYQLLNSARLLSSREMKLISAFIINAPEEKAIETIRVTRSSKHSKRTLRHSISVTPSSILPTDLIPHVHSAPVISPEHASKEPEHQSHKKVARKMTTGHRERQSVTLEIIDEKQESLETGKTNNMPLSDVKLREVLIEHGHFSIPRSKQTPLRARSKIHQREPDGTW